MFIAPGPSGSLCQKSLRREFVVPDRLQKNTVFGIMFVPYSESVGFQSVGLGTGDTKMDAPKNRNNAGTLLELSLLGFKAGLMKLAGTLLEPGEPLLERGETLLEPRRSLIAGTSGWNILPGSRVGVDFAVLFALFLALLNVPGCDVATLA